MQKPRGARRSDCAVANTLDIVGDKWTLLVIRDMFHGRHTYGELLDSPERIPTNILADRLKKLEAAGLVASSAYQDRPTRYAYRLTGKGEALSEMLLAIVRWGLEHVPGARTLTGTAAKTGKTSAAIAKRAPVRRRKP